MIERVSGSLEIGGRHLVRNSYRHIHAKRSLHSTFWCHGAGDINLPSWWLSLLYLPFPNHTSSWRQLDSGACTSLHHQCLGGDIFEFLYPAKTLALMRRLASTEFLHLKKRRQKVFLRHALRSYTSDATGASTDAGLDLNQPTLLGDQSTSPRSDRQHTDNAESEFYSPSLERGHRKSSEVHTVDFQAAAQRYKFILESKGPSDPELDTLFQRAEVAGRILISYRAQLILSGVQRLPFAERRRENYDCAIQAALDLKMLQDALRLYKESIKHARESVRSSSLLRYAIEHNEWEVALTIWKTCRQRDSLELGHPDIWKDIDALNLSFLMSQGIKLADFVGSFSQQFGRKNTVNQRGFAVELILRALDRVNEHFDLYQQAEIFEKLSKLTTLETNHFNKAIKQLLSVGQKHFSAAAIKLYGVMRQDRSLIPPQSILESLMAKWYDANGEVDGPDIVTIFEDYKFHYEVPKARAYRLAIAAMAYQGDSSTVYSLFEDFRVRHPASISADTLWDLLYLHSQRAEVEKADNLFQEFPTIYGIKPKVRCWNLMIAIHSSVSDLDGALRYYNQLLESGSRPNYITFATMISMYGTRGEAKAIEDLLAECEQRGIPKTCAMIDPLVLAHIRDDNFDSAERVAKEALSMRLTGVRTRMWNHILNALAIRRDFVKVNQTLQTMRDNDVPMDSFTYAALLHSLCITGRPSAAYKVLTVVMDHQGIKSSPLHYALVMSGFISKRKYQRAIDVFAKMLESKRPDFNTQQVVITAAGYADLKELSEKGQEAQYDALERAETLLNDILSKINPQELATHGPVIGAGFQRLDEAYTAGYFAFLINAYGKRGAYDRVAWLYDRYIVTTRTFQSRIKVDPPINILVALMTTWRHAKEHEEVERCWRLVMEKSEQLARRSDAADLSQPGWVLPSRRHILSQPLSYYADSLALTGRADEIQPLLDRLLRAGYDPDNRCWNKLVQMLCCRNRQVHAFEMCEEVLMPTFPGWRMRNFMGALKKQIPRPYQLGLKMPMYKTFVYLAAAYMNLRDQQAFRSVGDTTLVDLHENCPKTMNAIRSMPLIRDEMNPVRVRRKMLEGRI